MARRGLSGQVRIDRTADLDTRPSANGHHPQVRLRSPREGESARSSVVRRLAQPLPVAGVVLVLAALAGYWSVYSATTGRTPVVVAAHDLEAGAILRTSDLRTADLAGNAEVLAALVPERELETVLGRELTAPVAGGAPLARRSVAAGGSGAAAFTLVVPAMRAVGGSLRSGDRVTVLATFESGAGDRARAIARGLRVLDVGQAPEGFDSASASIPVTVDLTDPSVAAVLALANSEGKIDLLREGGASRAVPIPAAGTDGGS
jgi:Flp pilus assembly protein CpaB